MVIVQECIKVLGQLPQATCPAADASLQQPHLGKVLAHLKKNLQVSAECLTDNVVDMADMAAVSTTQ